MYDRRKVKVTSHMVDMTVEKHPALAKEIVQRGHEPAAHGHTWEPIYSKTPFEERTSYQENVQAIQRATGARPIGFNAPGMRATLETFGILRDQESAHKRRMISVSAHDRGAGRASRMRVIEDFIIYAQRHAGVVFMRKDEIAKFALASPITIHEGDVA